ncbi:hypothetical protein V3W47_15425 [Deinococcus sp. YIM 134068]|uniref:hypothetical protein n=1 Tax=Deinococcus lichenicola TaxID=3118910 RepID=UPI002F94C372
MSKGEELIFDRMALFHRKFYSSDVPQLLSEVEVESYGIKNSFHRDDQTAYAGARVELHIGREGESWYKVLVWGLSINIYKDVKRFNLKQPQIQSRLSVSAENILSSMDVGLSNFPQFRHILRFPKFYFQDVEDIETFSYSVDILLDSLLKDMKESCSKERLQEIHREILDQPRYIQPKSQKENSNA